MASIFIKSRRFLLVILCFTGMIPFTIARGQGSKKLVQFGWDYPTVSFLKTHLGEMQKQPFDGVAFSFDFKIFDLFDTIAYPEKNFQFDDLPGLKWGSFTDNFIRVRAQSMNGPNWTDDKAWNNIILNVHNISKAVQLSGAKGIFFDPEYYYGALLPDKNPWIYNDTLYPHMTYQEVGEYVRKRGEQFVKAIQYYKEDTKILSFYLLSLVTLQARLKPLEQTGMALYPFFVQGMFAGKNPKCEIIDGNELAFSYRYEFQFVFAGERLRDWGKAFIPDSLKSVYQNLTVSQPVFYDRIYGTFPQFDEEKLNPIQKANWLYSNLYYAYKTSDEYVWFYNSKIDWWRSNNDAIASVIRSVQARERAEAGNRKRTLTGNSSLKNFFSLMPESQADFSYSYKKSTKALTVNFNGLDISDFYVFENSQLLYTITDPPEKLYLTLNKYSKKGNLILVSLVRNGKYSFAFIN